MLELLLYMTNVLLVCPVNCQVFRVGVAAGVVADEVCLRMLMVEDLTAGRRI